jgi:ubiquinone/menaquinone biosynthesis C-methylase UbiE
VAIPVAEATGRPIIGIDLSPTMLEQARARAAAACVEFYLRQGNIRDLRLDEQAALIYCPFRTPSSANVGRRPCLSCRQRTRGATLR